uniref:Solute carrier family 22 member 6 n=1 Tax=Mola mola TaxID=94237 RepID=A0A3Q3X3L8_MOLML
MGFADLLEEVGGFGRYQWLHVTLISLPAWFGFGSAVLHERDWSFQVDEKQLLKAFIPLDPSGIRLDRCRRYVEPQWQLLAANSSVNVSQLKTEDCLDGWTFDRSEFFATTVSEWELVCSLRPLKQMIQTIYMGGVLAGAIIYGGLSDRFGRRSVLIWSYLQLAVLGCSSALSPSYTVYCIFRFLSGMAVSGVILNGVSLKVEWIPTKERTLVGTLTSFFFTFGQMILAGLAYWLRDWRKLQVVVCVPNFLFFAYSWWYSESARWLVLKRRSDEALKTLHRVARINGKSEMIDKLTIEVLHSHMKKEIESSQSSFTAYDLLRTRGMRRISVCLVFVWFSTSFAYYGLAMDLQKFGVSIYLMQIIFGAVDIPAKLLALASLTYLGRRFSQATCLFLSALVIFTNIFIPTDMQTIRTTLACLGKGLTSASFTVVYLYTGELYPTMTASSILLANAPVLLYHISQVLPALPSVVYGGAAVLAGCFACFLPETLNIPLPDTIDDDVSLQEGVASECGGVVSAEGVALKELRDVEGTGLNAL